MVRSTLPGPDGVQPNFSDLDLTPWYDAGYLEVFSYVVEPDRLNLVGSARGAKLDVLEFVLRSDDVRTGDYALHTVGMAVHRGIGYRGRTLVFTLRNDFFALDGDRQVPTPTVTSAWVDVPTAIRYVRVDIEPVEKDWGRLKLVVRDGYSSSEPLPVTFAAGNGFVLQPGARESNVRPWFVSAGIIGGDLQRVGMTAAFEFALRPIVD